MCKIVIFQKTKRYIVYRESTEELQAMHCYSENTRHCRVQYFIMITKISFEHRAKYPVTTYDMLSAVVESFDSLPFVYEAAYAAPFTVCRPKPGFVSLVKHSIDALHKTPRVESSRASTFALLPYRAYGRCQALKTSWRSRLKDFILQNRE